MFCVDPFARVAFLNYSQATEISEKTLCPTWDQTLIFEMIEIYGEPQNVAVKPPPLVIEIFDHDPFVRLLLSSLSFLPRCIYAGGLSDRKRVCPSVRPSVCLSQRKL